MHIVTAQTGDLVCVFQHSLLIKNKMNNHFFYSCLFLLLFGLIACNKEQPVPEAILTAQAISSAESYGSGENCGDHPLVLGTKLNNPYTPANMLLAADVLEDMGVHSLNPVQVRTTHLYVRFAPANWDEYAIIANTAAILYAYPLDYNILIEGNFYHDPSIPIDLPTFQYASVKSNFEFPEGIPYQILSELYIPEEDVSLLGNEDTNSDYVYELLHQAYLQTGNENSGTANKKSAFTPGGKIEIFDTRLNANIGLEGVEVRANRWFITHTATTNDSGLYRMTKTFNDPCNYSLYFKTDKFEVRDGFMSQAWVNGPKIKADWNHTLANGYDRFVGHIFRGAYRYHHLPIDGLRRPFITPLGAKNILKAVDADKGWAGTNSIVFPIKIARFRINNVEYQSDEIYSATCHELGHTSHNIVMNAGVIQYIQVSSLLRESWCTAVEWTLTRLEYKARGIAAYADPTYIVNATFPIDYGLQDWLKGGSSYFDEYSPLFIDLVDNYDQSQDWAGRPVDAVSGYTLATIESTFLKHSYGLTSLSQNLKANKPTGVTDAQIDNLIQGF